MLTRITLEEEEEDDDDDEEGSHLSSSIDTHRSR